MTMNSSASDTETELHRLTSRVLSPGSRYGHVALLLVGLLMCVLLISLLATEPDLPPRTSLAFAVMLGIGTCWVGYASWVLRFRRPLLGVHRVVAGWMAVLFTALFLGGAAVMLISRGGTEFEAAVVSGAVMFALALAVLFQARARVRRLQARRAELEQQLRTQT